MKHTKVFNDEGKLQKAGGLIVRIKDGNKEVLLISTNNRRWAYPKGHLEKNESLEECALRECKEETGLDLEIIEELPFLEYPNLGDGDKIIVHMYLMKVIGGELKKEFKSDKLRWVPVTEASRLLGYQNLLSYLKIIKDEK